MAKTKHIETRWRDGGSTYRMPCSRVELENEHRAYCPYFWENENALH